MKLLQFTNDPEICGDQASCWLVVANDGETHIAGPFPTLEMAQTRLDQLAALPYDDDAIVKHSGVILDYLLALIDAVEDLGKSRQRQRSMSDELSCALSVARFALDYLDLHVRSGGAQRD